MTFAQWLWEYEALKRKEKEDVETTLELMKLFRLTLIKLLGLDLLIDKADRESSVVPESLYVPMVLMVGRREVVDVIMKRLDEEAVIQKTMKDDDFEKMSAAIARGEDFGDMEPVMSDFTQNDTVKELLYKEELAAAGVKLVDHVTNAPHSQLNNDEAIKRSENIMKELNAARRSIAKQIVEEKLENKPKATIKFDDDA